MRQTVLAALLAAIAILSACIKPDNSLVLVVKILDNGEIARSVDVELSREGNRETLTRRSVVGRVKFPVSREESKFQLYITRNGLLVYSAEINKSRYREENNVIEVIVDVGPDRGDNF